jgi:hypothetical protein
MKKQIRSKIKPVPVGPPINVALPNTTTLKMEAILVVARAIENLTKAITSTNVHVSVANNHIQGAEYGIHIAAPESA